MDNNKKNAARQQNHHTADFLASTFLGSNISLKKIYGLKTLHWAIIRYLCDSIDKNYNKKHKFETKIYQSQIAKFTILSRKTINKEIQHLIKKRIFKYVGTGLTSRRNTLTIGKTLIACNCRLQDKEVLPTVTSVRSVTQGYISNSSNITNYQNGSSNPKKADQQFKDSPCVQPTSEKYKLAPTAKKGSTYLEDFIRGNSK
jgi:hypothetical protein